MKVLMLGWEFPPFISGGLGTACYGLTKAMSRIGIEVTFVLPKVIDGEFTTHVKLLDPESACGKTIELEEEFKNIKFKTISSPLTAYSTADAYQQQLEERLTRKQQISDFSSFIGRSAGIGSTDYAGDMYTEIQRYAALVTTLAADEDFDVIHAHDWMTYPAAIAVARRSGKPLIVHVHSTEFDRSGENVNQVIYDIEREGMHTADIIIPVSRFTSSIITDRYGISEDKIEVVHNGVEHDGRYHLNDIEIDRDEKIVLFLGRITMQKGPEYFLTAAKKVLEITDKVKFVMAGSGDMMHRAIEMAAELGIGNKVLFTGFLRGDDVRKVYQMADLFVMPSVSEPFGLVPLEALGNDVPVIISKQSGVSEVLTHILKVDFWDIDEMANKIVAVLKYSPLRTTLRNYGNFEVRKLRWEDAARKCADIYEKLIASPVSS